MKLDDPHAAGQFGLGLGFSRAGFAVAALVFARPVARLARLVGNLQLLSRLLLLAGEEFVERLAGGEPVLLAAGEDVIDGQPPGSRVAAGGVRPQADPPPLQRQQRFLQRRQRAAEPLHLGPGDAAAAGLEDRVLQPGVQQLRLHLLFRLHVVGLFLVADAEQRRLGHVDVPAPHQVVHLPIEEGQQQGADVRAVHVGVGHDDDLAVAALAEVDFFADAGADGRDDAADLFVGQDLVVARLVGVDDFAAQGEDGLVLADAAALGAAAGGIALDEVQFAALHVAAGAIAEFARQAAAA